MKDYQVWQQKADLLRKWCLVSTTEAKSGHPTSCLSAADLTAVLFDKYFRYNIADPLYINNDRFVLSKGHASPLLYALFAMAGAMDVSQLKTLRKFGSELQGHPVPLFPYTEAATGSLGQGLSVGAGLALVAKRERHPFKTFVLSGDGELAEGQVWEAANFAAHEKLDNLILIADINRLGQSQPTMFGHNMQAYLERFRAFGFETIGINGHDFAAINAALDKAVHNTNGKPVAIVAETIKGKGVSFLEDKDGWHGKALKPDELEKALAEIHVSTDTLSFNLKEPAAADATEKPAELLGYRYAVDSKKEHATREVFGAVLADISKQVPQVYALDGDVMNSTFTEDLKETSPGKFIECFIAEQNMVSVAAGLSRLGKIPFVATFGAFFTRAADQARMARISKANIKFVGSHAGVSIGEDGPSQMALEDIALFGAWPGTIVLQPADAYCTAALVTELVQHKGMAYLRTLRPKTALLYSEHDNFKIGGSVVLRKSDADELTVVASGITVFEALKAYDQLLKEDIRIRVVDCYSVNPVDKKTLLACARSTKQNIVVTVEDHFAHGGLGDFVATAISEETGAHVLKLAVQQISQSGTKDELMEDAGIDAASIIAQVKACCGVAV